MAKMANIMAAVITVAAMVGAVGVASGRHLGQYDHDFCFLPARFIVVTIFLGFPGLYVDMISHATGV